LILGKLSKGRMQHFNRDNVLYIRWHDKRDVYIITTIHSSLAEKRTNKWGEEVMKPSAVFDYNANMGLVDKADMLLSGISSVRKSRKWYRKLFFHFMDIFMLNSYYMYVIVTGKKCGLREFIEHCINQIVDDVSDVNIAPVTSFGQFLLEHKMEPLPLMPSGTARQRQCVACYANGRAKRSRKQCRKCKVPLCNHNCFVEFHQHF